MNTPVLAVNATAVTVPLTPSDVSVPTDVIFGCAAVVTVPAVVAVVAVVALDTVPVTLAPVIELSPLPLPEIKLALTKLAPVICDAEPLIVMLPLAANVRPVNEVLTDVMFG